MPILRPGDDQLVVFISDWFQLARHELDDIMGWRAAPPEVLARREWVFPDKLFPLTQGVVLGIVAQFPTLDTTPITKASEIIGRWYSQRNAAGLPNNEGLERLLEAVAVVVVAVRDGAYLRSTPIATSKRHSRRHETLALHARWLQQHAAGKSYENIARAAGVSRRWVIKAIQRLTRKR